VKSYRSATAILAAIDEIFAETRRRPGEDAPLDRTVEALTRGRNYLWTGVYLFVEDSIVCATACGPIPAPHLLAFGAPGAPASEKIRVISSTPGYKMRFAESKAEAIVPIKFGGRVLGVLDVESERSTGFSPQEQVFLKKVATAIARFFTGRGKYVIQQAKDAVARQQASKSSLRAAAGEQQT
jgi:putative methionine-R-sulfoxide reductase with GAF domain